MDQLAQSILIVFVILIMGWFAFGIVRNLRRGNAVLKWMQIGLPRLGERTSLRWLGSSAVDLNIARAKAPFRQIQLLIVLEPRDVPWFWLIAHARGRRDMLIVRGQLLTTPQYEFDLLAPNSWSESERSGRADARQWNVEPLAEMNFRAPQTTRSLSRAMASPLLQTAQHVHPIVWRLSTRREDPHFELHIPLPDPKMMDAAQFFTALQGLADQMSKRS
jgi:hypothetical protein